MLISVIHICGFPKIGLALFIIHFERWDLSHEVNQPAIKGYLHDELEAPTTISLRYHLKSPQ